MRRFVCFICFIKAFFNKADIVRSKEKQDKTLSEYDYINACLDKTGTAIPGKEPRKSHRHIAPLMRASGVWDYLLAIGAFFDIINKFINQVRVKLSA
ncbi:hypothetical protein SDC9_112290 [bioreactor metagenome]|uniref:Uncharacterized protein n=1 Tax=bioreactor metagenome TaxID=1076179 RepID=A0A645BUC0_9ZZZZ